LNQRRKRLPVHKNKSPPERSVGKIRLLLGLMLVVCAIVVGVHGPVLSTQAMSFDDNKYLTQNSLVQNPGWDSTRRFFTEILSPSKRGYYQPMTMLSLMADYALGGRSGNLRQFHRTSLVLHAANTMLVILLLYLLFSQTWIAVSLGLLFGLHPINVEAIAWLSERTTMLSSFFALLCLIIYVLYVRKKGWKLYLVCIATYILALMSKPTTIPLPLLMLLLDYWPLQRWPRSRKDRLYHLIGRAIRDKLPFFVLAGIFVYITIVSRVKLENCPLVVFADYGPWKGPLLFCHNITFYLYKIVWPTKLSAFYPFPEVLRLSDTPMLAGVIATCVLIVLLVISLRWTPAVLICGLIYIVALGPTIQAVSFSISVAADKYVYLPSIGLLMLLALLAGRLGQSTKRQITIVIIVLFLAGGESVATRRYLGYWRDKITLYEYMLTVAPKATPVHLNLGQALEMRGELDKAAKHFSLALQSAPRHPIAHYNLGSVLYDQGKIDEAISCFRQALRLRPNFFEAHNNLANILGKQDRPDAAIKHYRRALQIEPDNADTHYRLGNLLLQDSPNQAIYHYRQVILNKPDHAQAHNKLGAALSDQGKLSEAADHYRRALQLKPDYPEAHNNLAKVISNQGKLDEAADHYHQALELEPNYADAANNLGILLASQGRLDEGISRFQQALQIDPNHLGAHNNLGNSFQMRGETDKAIWHYRRALEIKPDSGEVLRNLKLLEAQDSGPGDRQQYDQKKP